MCRKRNGPFLSTGLLVILAIGGSRAQDQNSLLEITPPFATDKDNLAFRLSGAWRNGCVPQSPQVTVEGALIKIATSNAGAVCIQAITPWQLSGSIGRLPAAVYLVQVTFSGPGMLSSIELVRKSFTVSNPQETNERILPIVVNGAIDGKTYYQTIFTMLNASTQEVQAALQVYSNAGNPGGVFCSPLAPPPSSITIALKPNAQYLRFTSAELPFHNGWARLSWVGPPSLLAFAEVTLVTGSPAPCQLVCNVPSTEKLASTAVPAVQAGRDFQLPVTLSANRQTALALVNPSTTDSVNVKVSILASTGEPANLGVPNSFDLKIGPQERVSKYLWQMALEHSALTVIVPVPELFYGSVILHADAPMAAAALNLMFPEGKFVGIPSVSPP
jgi:hypothetical protein